MKLIKKYLNPHERFDRPIAASDLTASVSDIRNKELKQDVTLQTINKNNMRSTDPKVRLQGKEDEKNRRKNKAKSSKQVLNPHSDAAIILDSKGIENLTDLIISNAVAREAEINNPYGLYRASYDRTSPGYLGTISPLTREKWEEQRGFFGNIDDALGTTDARFDPNRNWLAQGVDNFLWNLNSKNPRGFLGGGFDNGLPNGGLYSAFTNPAMMITSSALFPEFELLGPESFLGRGLKIATLPAINNGLNLWRMGIGTGVGLAVDNITTPFTGKTVGQHFGDWVPIMTGTAGDVAVTLGSGTAITSPKLRLYVVPSRIRYAMSEFDPYGYDHGWQEYKDVIKTILNPKWKFNPEEQFMTMPGKYREESVRRAFKIPLRSDMVGDEALYVPNGDGTYRYNLKVAGTPYKSQLNKVLRLKPGESTVISDPYPNGQGGDVRIIRTLDGDLYMVDDWDLHPYKRNDYGQGGVWSSSKPVFDFMRKIGLLNLEMVSAIGGEPIRLVHPLELP